MATRTVTPLIVIVGPTASGKTVLAIELAEKYGGEIICADSRTVYQGMNIGTAKPTRKEQARIPHWGLDLVEPSQSFSVADFKQYADDKIREIRARGNVPFLVGGTGLYIDAVLFDFQFGAPADIEFRRRLEGLSLEELHKYCVENNIELPENKQNKRYVIRMIERTSTSVKGRDNPIDDSIVVGIATSSQTLRSRIASRAEQLFDDEVVVEARELGDKYGWTSEAMTGNIYPLVREYLDEQISFDEMKQRFIVLDRRLAKRQMTWLRRNPFILWCTFDDLPEAVGPSLASE